MNATLQDNIRNLISYYSHHKVEEMIKTHPSFVTEDFTRLLAELEAEYETSYGSGIYVDKHTYDQLQNREITLDDI